MADKTKKPVKKKPVKKKTAKVVEKRPVGRPTKYKPEYCQAIIEFFSIPTTDKKGNALDPKFFMNFCLEIGITTECMGDWIIKYPDFSDAYKIAKAKQEQHLVINTLQNRYNASFAWKSMMNMFQWRDKSDNIHTGKDGGPLQIISTLPEPDGIEPNKN